MLDGARSWADLLPDERRRRATLAAQYANASELWSLTEAHTYLWPGWGRTVTLDRTLVPRGRRASFSTRWGRASV